MKSAPNRSLVDNRQSQEMGSDLYETSGTQSKAKDAGATCMFETGNTNPTK